MATAVGNATTLESKAIWGKPSPLRHGYLPRVKLPCPTHLMHFRDGIKLQIFHYRLETCI